MRFVIWGGRRNDIWIGSPADHLIHARLNMATAAGRQAIRLGQAIGPSMAELARAFAQLAKILPSTAELQRREELQVISRP